MCAGLMVVTELLELEIWWVSLRARRASVGSNWVTLSTWFSHVGKRLRICLVNEIRCSASFLGANMYRQDPARSAATLLTGEGSVFPSGRVIFPRMMRVAIVRVLAEVRSESAISDKVGMWAKGSQLVRFKKETFVVDSNVEICSVIAGDMIRS